MSIRRLFFFLLVAVAILLATAISTKSNPNPDDELVAGRNVNMVSGRELPWGDPYLQRQNEPSIAVSTRNPMHLLAGANDYRTIDIPMPLEELPGEEIKEAQELMLHPPDAWLGVFKSYDGGQSWISTLLPGYPQDPEGTNSPLWGYEAAADPVVRAGPNGLFYYSGIAFNRVTKEGVVFVARFIDNNNQEKGDMIKYIDTSIIDTGDGAEIFLDKSWIAVDIPRSGPKGVIISGPDIPEQYVPDHNVYIAYTAFSATGDSLRSKILFAKSTDCGETWSEPIRLDNNDDDGDLDYKLIPQGATIAVDPRNGMVYVSWRQFDLNKQNNAIFIARSPDRGRNFQKPIKVATIDSFDQGTIGLPDLPLAFRFNSYPTLTVDSNGIVYIAWSQRGWGPDEDSRIVLTSSNNGRQWSTPSPIDKHMNRGHQFWPSLTFAAGKLVMIWHDQRYDIATYANGNWDANRDKWIAENAPLRRTTDIRVAQAEPGLNPIFDDSKQVSRYLFGLYEENDEWIARQMEFNPPNYPLFANGTTPFHGDYMDIASLMFLPEHKWRWSYNTNPNNSAVFHATWTDNRDVRVPPHQDWTDPTPWMDYTPPISDQDDEFETPGRLPCDGDKTGIKNQNIYTSRISSGLVAGCLGNTKPLRDIQRTFAIFVKNTTDVDRHIRLSISAPFGVEASFFESGPTVDTLDVSVAKYSSISRTVFVNPTSDPNALITVYIEEIDGYLQSFILLNPDNTNPDLIDSDLDFPTPHIDNYELQNPHIDNPHIDNWNYGEIDPHVANPHIDNSDLANPHIDNPHIDNPHIDNKNIANPHIDNPHIDNFSLPDTEITDVTWKVTNNGNTSSSYTFKAISTVTIPPQVIGQIIIYKSTKMPVSNGCELVEVSQDELILSVPLNNPGLKDYLDPEQDVTNPHIDNPHIDNTTLSLAPGEEAFVTLRFYSPDKYGSPIPDQFQDEETVTEVLTPVGVTQALSTGETERTVDTTLIQTTSLPAGIVGASYSATLEASGGVGTLIWSWISKPTWLHFVSSAVGNTVEIGGTPTASGDHTVIVRVDDSVSSLSDTQEFILTVLQPGLFSITTESPLTPGIVDGVTGCGYYPGDNLTATGGSTPYTWSLATGDPLPTGLTLSEDGAISGTPEYDPNVTYPESYEFIVQVADSSVPSQSADKLLNITTTLPTLGIGTIGLQDGYIDQVPEYTWTLIADCGIGDLEWSWTAAEGHHLPPGLNLDTYTGMISGTPASDPSVIYPHTYDFIVYVLDPVGSRTASKELSITIAEPLEITSASWLPSGLAGTEYPTTTLTATGGIASYFWPPGQLGSSELYISDDGVISGYPVAGYHTFPVEVLDSSSPPQLNIKEFNIIVHTVAPPTDLVSWWPGDNNAFDYVNGNHGTLEDGTTFAEGIVEDAFSFDGVDDWVLASGTGIDNLQQLTIETWVKFNSFPEGQIQRFVTLTGEKAVLRHDGENALGQRQLHFYMKFDGFPAGRHIRVNNVLKTGCFHHVVGTYDGSFIRLYLDGVEVGRRTASGVTVITGSGVELSSGGETLNGLLDEVKIYNIALDASDILNIYNNGDISKKCTSPLPQAKISGTVTEPDGPIVGATVTLSGSSDATTTTDSNGYYEFTDLVAGGYLVTLTNPDPAGLAFPFLSKDVLIKELDATITIDFTANAEIAYIYSTDTTSANSYKDFLYGKGYLTDLIQVNSVTAGMFDDYGLILIGSDTEGTIPGEWRGDSSKINAINDSGKPIIGLGEGGYDFFGELNLDIGYPHGWHDVDNELIVVDSSHLAFNSPNNLGVTTGQIISVYTSSGHVGINMPSPPEDIVLLGREKDELYHYILLQEDNRYLLWGFTHSPDFMTQTGKDLFENVISWFSGPQITTVAGNGTAAYSGDEGPATSASLNMPRNVTVDSAGNIFIADSYNYVIRKVDTSGYISTVAGNGTSGYSGDGGPATSAQMGYLGGVAVDSSGNIYIAMYSYSKIRKVDTGGIITTLADVYFPNSIAIDSSDNIYFSEAYRHWVRKVDTGSTITTVVGTGTAGFNGDGGPATTIQLNQVQGIAVDIVGNIYIADKENHRIRKVDLN